MSRGNANIGARCTDELTLVRRRRLGFVFQFFNLLPNLPCWQNIAMPLLIDGAAPDDARARAEVLAKGLGISHRLDTRAAVLSGPSVSYWTDFCRPTGRGRRAHAH